MFEKNFIEPLYIFFLIYLLVLATFNPCSLTYGVYLNSLIMKVRGQISVYNGGSLIFGLSDFPISEFELVAEELLMSDSIIKVQYSDSKCFGSILIPLGVLCFEYYFCEL